MSASSFDSVINSDVSLLIFLKDSLYFYLCVFVCVSVCCMSMRVPDLSSALFGNNRPIVHSMIARRGFGFPGTRVPGTIWLAKL